MQVIGAGPGRTGTMSTMTALELLGFGPCHHMSVVMQDRAQQDAWTNILAGAEPDWPAVLNGFGSCIDWPTATYWRELAAAFPDAKILLTTRDPDAWYDSMSRTILPLAYADQNALRSRLIRASMRLTRPHLARLVTQFPHMMEAFFATSGRFPTRDEAVAAFNRRIAEVRETIPADRLLIFDVKQGWGPLCEFLDVPVPSEPFPRTNDAAAFRQNVPLLARTRR